MCKLHKPVFKKKIHEALYVVLDTQDENIEAPALLLKMNRYFKQNHINNHNFLMPLHLFKLAAALRAHLVINHLFILMNFFVSLYTVPCVSIMSLFNVLSVLNYTSTNLHNPPRLVFAYLRVVYVFIIYFVIKVLN